MCTLMELRFIIFLHITNRPVHIKTTRLYTPNKREGESESREKKIQSINNTMIVMREHIHYGAALVNDQLMNEI